MAYFANGTEGIILDKQCEDCPLSEIDCPVYVAHLMYNYDAVNNATATGILNTLVGSDKICLMRKALIQENVKTRKSMIEKLKKHNKLWEKMGKSGQYRKEQE